MRAKISYSGKSNEQTYTIKKQYLVYTLYIIYLYEQQQQPHE